MDNKTVASGLGPNIRPSTTIETAQRIDQTVQEITVPNLDVMKTSTFESLNKITKTDSIENEARTQAGLQAASGVVRSEELPQYELPKYNSELYDSTIGVTKYDELRHKLNLAPDQSFTDYYNSNNGYVPEGFELSAKLLIHEEKVKGLQDQYLNNEMGYEDFLYKAYGKDILKANGHDFASSLYWYNKMRNGDYDDIRDNLTYMRSILNQAEAAHQSEVWFRQSGKLLSESMLQYVNDAELPTATVKDIFKDADWESLNEQHGSTQKVIDLYRAGMLSGFQPWVDTDKDGKPDFYYHTDGKLYEVRDENEKEPYDKTTAVAIYNADGSLQRIRVRNRFGGFGEFTQNVAKGGYDFVTGVLSLGALAFGAAYDLGELVFTGDTSLNRLGDSVVFTEKAKNLWGWMGADYTTSSGFTNSDGTINYQGIFNGVGYSTGLIASMFLTGGLTAAVNPAAYTKLTTTKVVQAYADDAVRAVANLTDDVLKQPKNLRELFNSLKNLPNKYIADDIVAAANKLGIKTTPAQVAQLAKQSGYELGRTSAKIAMDAGRGLLSKGFDGVKWTFRTMSGVRNGMPSVNTLGKYGSQIATRNSLAVLAAKEFAETAGHLTALQGESNLSNGQILGIAAGTSIANFAISMGLRATLDEGALDRHAKWLAGKIQKSMTTGVSLEAIMKSGKTGSNFIRKIYEMHKNHPILLSNIQNGMDVAENLLTLTLNNTAMNVKSKDGKVDWGTVGQNLSAVINPQALFMNMWMAYGNMKGNPLSRRTETGMKMGEIWNAQSDITSLFDDSLKVLKAEAARLDMSNKPAEANRLNKVILEIEKTASNSGKEKFDTKLHAQIAALEQLNDVLPKTKEKTTTIIEEAISKNYTKEQRSRILVNARLQMTQYDAIVKDFKAKQKEILNGTFSDKVSDIISGDAYVRKIVKTFENNKDIDLEAMQKQYKDDLDVFKKRDNIIKLASKDSGKIIDESKKFIDTYVKPYTYGAESVTKYNEDGTYEIVVDPKFVELIGSTKEAIEKNGDDPAQGTYIKIDTAGKFFDDGKPVQNSEDDLRIRGVYDALAIAGEADIENGISPLIYKVGDGVYFIPNRGINNEVRIISNATHLLRNATLMRRSNSEDVRVLSFVNILKTLATGEDSKLINSLPETAAALNKIIKDKKNKNLSMSIERIANNVLMLSTDPNVRTMFDLKTVHDTFGKDFEFTYSDGILYKFNTAIKGLDQYTEYQRDYLNAKDDPTRSISSLRAIRKSLTRYYNDLDLLLSADKNLFDYMTKTNIITPSFVKDLEEALKTMGELSASQELDKKISKLFRGLNTLDITDANNIKIGEKLLDIMSGAFAEQEQTIDKYNISLRKNIKTNINNSEILKSKGDMVNKFISNNKVLTMPNNDIKAELNKAEYKDLSDTEKNEILNLIQRSKVAEFKKIFNNNQLTNYNNTIKNEFDKLIQSRPSLLTELGIVERRKNNKLIFSAKDFRKIEDYVLANSDITNNYFSRDTFDIMREAYNFRAKLFEDSVAKESNVVIVNVLELKGKMLQKLISGLGNANVIESLSRQDSPRVKENIIKQIFGSMSPAVAINMLNKEIEAIQQYYTLTKLAGNPGMLTFKLNEDGANENLNKLLEQFNYDVNIDGDLIYDIPGVYKPGKTNNVDEIEVKSSVEVIGEMQKLAREWEDKNRNVATSSLEQKVNNLKARTSVNLETAVGGLAYIDDNSIIRDVKDLKVNDFEVTSDVFTDYEVKNIMSGPEFGVGLKQGLLASLTRQVQSIVRNGIGLMGRKNQDYSRAVNVVKIIDAAKNVISNKTIISPYRIQMTDEYAAKVIATGMYNVIKVDGQTYNVQLIDNAKAFETAAYNYIKNANKDTGIDLSVFLLAGKTSYAFKTEDRSTTTIQNFVDAIKAELNYQEKEFNLIIDDLKNATADKKFVQYNFDNDETTKKEIQKLFNGKSVKEILSMKNDKYKNHILFVSYINTIKAGKLLSEKIVSTLNKSRFIESPELKELARKIPLLGNRAIREELATIFNKNIGNSNVDEKFFINAAEQINNFIVNKDWKNFTLVSLRQNVNDKQTEFSNAFYESVIDNVYGEDQRFTADNLKVLFDSMNQKIDNAAEYNVFDVVNKDNPYANILSSLMMNNTGNNTNRFNVGPIQAVRLDDQEYDELVGILSRYSTNSTQLSAWKQKLDELRIIASRGKNRTRLNDNDEVLKKVTNLVGNVIGTGGPDVITAEGPARQQLEKLILDKVKNREQKNKRLFKVSDAFIDERGPLSYMNQIMRERYGDDTAVGLTAKASRTFFNQNDIDNRSAFVKGIYDVSTRLAKDIGRLQLDNDLDINTRLPKFVNLAEKIYALTTGIDFSKEYTRYLLVNDEGEIILSANTSGSDYREVADFIKELNKQGKNIKTEVIDGETFKTFEGKKLYLLQLEKNMLIDTDTRRSPIKVLKLNSDNYNRFMSVAFKSILDNYNNNTDSEVESKAIVIKEQDEQSIIRIESVLNKFYNQKSIDNFKIETIAKLVPDSPDSYNQAKKILFGYKNYLIDSKENNLKQEAIANTFISVNNIPEDVSNILLKNLNEIFTYGFTSEVLSDGVRAALIGARTSLKESISARITNYKLFENDLFSNKERKDLLIALNKAARDYNNKSIDDVNKSIAINSLKNKLNNILKTKNLATEYKARIELDFVNYLKNIIVANSNDAHLLSIKLLPNGIKDLAKAITKDDPYTFNLKDKENNNLNLNNILDKDILSVDVENIVLKPEYEEGNQNNNLVFFYSQSRIKSGSIDGTTKEKINVLNEEIRNYELSNNKSSLKSYEVDNKIIPVYVKDFNTNKYVLVNKENLSKYMTESSLEKLYKDDSGYKKVFLQYNEAIKDLPKELNSEADVRNTMNTFVNKQFDSKGYSELKDFYILGYNSETDRKKLRYLSNFNDNFKIINGEQAQWLDVLSDVIREWNFDTKEFDQKRSIEALTNKFLPNMSSKGLHDPEQDNIFTSYYFFKAIEHKQNNNSIKGNAFNTLEDIAKKYFGDEFNEDKNTFEEINKINISNLKNEDKLVLESIKDNFLGSKQIDNQKDKYIKGFKDIYNFELEKAEKSIAFRQMDKTINSILGYKKAEIDNVQNNVWQNSNRFLNYVMFKIFIKNNPTFGPTEFKNYIKNLDTKTLDEITTKISESFNNKEFRSDLDKLLKLDTETILSNFNEALKIKGFDYKANFDNNDFSLKEYKDLLEADTNNIFDQDLLGQKINSLGTTDEYKNFAANVLLSKSSIGLFKYKLGPVIFDAVKNISDSNLKALITNTISTAGLYSEDMDPNAIQDRKKSLHRMYSMNREMIQDILEDNTTVFTTTKETFYKPAAAIPINTKLKVYDSVSKNIKEVTADSNTIYMSPDQLAKMFGYEEYKNNYELINNVKGALNIKPEDPLYVLVTRHPHTKSTNNHVFKVELVEVAKDNAKQIFIDRNVARSYFNGDFDGDGYAFYKPDLMTQVYGKQLEEQLNFANRLYKDLENEVFKTVGNKYENINAIYPQVKVILNQEVLSADSLRNDLIAIQNSPTKYQELKSIREKEVEALLNNKNIKWFNDIDFDDEERKAFAKDLISKFWIKETPTGASGTLQTKFIYHTDNEIYTDASVGFNSYRQNFIARQQALQTKTLLFETRAEADINVGVYNKAAGRRVINQSSDKLGEVLNFNRFFVDDASSGFIKGNTELFYKSLLNKINNGVLKDYVSDIVINNLKTTIENDIKSIEANPKLAYTFGNKLVDIIDIVNQEIYLSQKLFDNYKNVVETIKALPQDTADRDKLINLFRNYFGAEDTKKYEEGIIDIFAGRAPIVDIKNMLELYYKTNDLSFAKTKNKNLNNQILDSVFSRIDADTRQVPLDSLDDFVNAYQTKILYVLDQNASGNLFPVIGEDALHIMPGKENKYKTLSFYRSNLDDRELLKTYKDMLANGEQRLIPGKHKIGKNIKVPSNDGFVYYIKDVDLNNNQIIYALETTANGSTKIGVPGSAVKGINAGFIPGVDETIKNIVRPEIYETLDFVGDAKNFDMNKLGIAANTAKIVYYDKNFNEIKTTGSIEDTPKAAYATLETKAKNVVFAEKWGQDLKKDKVGELSYANELLAPTGILFGLGRNYRYENFEGKDSDKASKVKLVYDNRGEASLLRVLKVIGGYNTGSMNAKLSYDLMRMIKVLENNIGKGYTEEQFKLDINKYIKKFMVNPTSSDTDIFNQIIDLYGSTNKFIDKLSNKKDYYGLTLFENDLSELFLNPDRAFQVSEGIAKTSRKTGQGYKDLVSQLKDTIGFRTLKQTSKLKDLADAASVVDLKEGSTYSEQHLDWLDFMNYLIEGKNKYLLLEGKDIDRPLTKNDVEFGISQGLLNITKGSSASTNNNFRIQPDFYKSYYEMLELGESAKSGKNQISNEPVVEITNKPQLLSNDNYDQTFNPNNVIRNKTTEYMINNKMDFKDGSIDYTSYENYTPNKNKVSLIGHAGKYKNTVERANALGIADDEIVVNTNLKTVRGTADKAIEIQMDPRSDKVLLKNAMDTIKNQNSSDLFAIVQDRINNNEDINIRDIFVQPALKETKAQKDLPDIGVKVEKVKAPELTAKQLLLLESFNENDIEYHREIIAKENEDKEPEQILAEYDRKFFNNKQLNSGNQNLYETDIKRDVLESSGYSTKTEAGFVTDRTIIQSRKNKVHYEMELSKTLHEIYDLSVRMGAENRISYYMFIKHKIMQYKDLQNRIDQFKDVDTQEIKDQVVKYNLAKDEILKAIGGTIEESEKYLSITEKYYGSVTKMADDYVQYVYENAKNFMSWTGNPTPAIYFLAVPNIPVGSNKQAFEHYKMNVFNQELDPSKMSAFNLANYNFFDSMKNIVKMISKEKAAFDIGRNLRMNGIMENQTVVEKTEELLENYVLNQLKDSQVRTTFDKDFDDALVMFADNLRATVMNSNAAAVFGPDYKFFSRDKSFTETYVDVYRKLTQYFKMEGISYDEAKAELNNKDPNARIKAEKLIDLYDMRDDVLVTLMKRGKVDVSYIYDALKNYAAENNLALTDKFGRLIPEKVSDFKVISNINFEYALKGIQYFNPYNGGYKNQIVLDMIAGDIYLTNKKVAEALDKVEYNRKPPSSFQRQLTKVTSLMTTLIMSNPFQLISRAAKWTAGDLGWGVMTDWRTLLKQGDAIKDIRAMYSSNGKAVDPNLKEFMYLYGIDPTKMNFNLLNNNLEDMESTGRIFNNKYTDFTGKIGNVQSMLERYAIFLALKDGFDTNKPTYGSVLNKQDLIDKMTEDVDENNNLRASANSRKAYFIMSQTLGAAGDFPDLSRNLNGYFMFTTYPLAMIRWARNEGASLATAFKNIFIESHPEKIQQSLKHLWVKGLGAAGLYAAIYLMNTLVAELYDVDEETKDEWIDEQATPELLKTLLQGSPVIDKYNSINPIRQITEKTLVPFFEAYENNEGNLGKSLLGGLGRFTLENFGNVNPILKNTIELISGGDIIEREVIPFNEQQDIYDNIFRKLAGYFIGSSGSRALTNYLSDIAPYQEEKDLGSKLLTGMGKAISAEFGNLKSYKSDVKNYYKANEIVQSYRFANNDVENLSLEERLLNPQFEGSSNDYNKLRKQINQLKFENAPLTKVYQAILQAREEGMDLKTIRSAVRNSSLEYKLSKVDDVELFYKTLDAKEIKQIEKALTFEDKFFGWLNEYDELLTNLINVDQGDQRYYPNIYNRDVYRPFLYQNYRQPRINTYYRKPYLRSPFSAYRGSYFELNPDKKTYKEE